MLANSARRSACQPARKQQSGVVLLIALIMLVAMTLGGIALVRSVNMTNIIAGNLAFQQGATNSGDMGIETAINWLQTHNSAGTLHGDIHAQGYSATRQDPAVNQSWDSFWRAQLAARAVTLSPSADGTTIAYTTARTAQNAAGNVISYAIQRLCTNAVAPTSAGSGCSQPLAVISTSSSSKGAGVVSLQYGDQVYYRITSRIAGPRNTVSYVQVIVAL